MGAAGLLYAQCQTCCPAALYCCFCLPLPQPGREELSATRELYDNAAAPSGRPLIIFNGELDRLRGGYYPGVFFPELAKLTNEFLPQVMQQHYSLCWREVGDEGGWMCAL